MSHVAIPAWTANGVLPPNDPSDPVSAERSPYVVSLTDFVLRFGNTPERCAILGGFLDYRAALHKAGLVQGFQWLDGSFLELVELIEWRPPNDVDVVTFFRLPSGLSQAGLGASLGPLLKNRLVKATYHVDAYLVDLGMDAGRLAEKSAYWYSLWSHRRDQRWKGFVQVDLAPAEDRIAIATLARLTTAGGTP